MDLRLNICAKLDPELDPAFFSGVYLRHLGGERGSERTCWAFFSVLGHLALARRVLYYNARMWLSQFVEQNVAEAPK
jgi:hypothetical protein